MIPEDQKQEANSAAPECGATEGDDGATTDARESKLPRDPRNPRRPLRHPGYGDIRVTIEAAAAAKIENTVQRIG